MYLVRHAYCVYNTEQSNSTHSHVQAAAAVGLALDEPLKHAVLRCAIDVLTALLARQSLRTQELEPVPHVRHSATTMSKQWLACTIFGKPRYDEIHCSRDTSVVDNVTQCCPITIYAAGTCTAVVYNVKSGWHTVACTAVH
eukprot:11602-Heterococcus_DN1.PRE.3